MRSLSLKLPKHLDVMIERLAKQRGVSRSAVIRAALEAYAANGTRRGSALEAAGDLVGSLKGGPRDLSYNPKYMKDYGK